LRDRKSDDMVAPHAEDQPEFVLSDEDFGVLVALVKRHAGIALKEQKRGLVYGRLVRRLRALGLDSFKKYCDLLATAEGEPEIARMVNAITTNLTSFFREPHHFNTLAKDVLEPLARNPGSRRLRVWSAGCSSGEEPYSIAMTLRAAIPAARGWDAKILATDIDTDILARAAAGRYDLPRLDSIPDRHRRCFSDNGDGTATIVPEVRSPVVFKPLNLLGPWPMQGPFDVIFCRNVVIYFDKDTQRELFDRFADLLAPDAWLFIGHSESLFNVSERFRLVGRTVYQRIR
jgi:chemotaxis protein methyltransferase CheR